MLCRAKRFSSDTVLVVLKYLKTNMWLDHPLDGQICCFSSSNMYIGITVQLEFKQTHQLMFMLIIRQQELFQSAGIYFIPFYLKIVDLF